MKIKTVLLFPLIICFSHYSHAEFKPAGSWDKAKNILDDKVYFDHRRTIYCGCQYESRNNDSGSGKIIPKDCGLENVPLKKNASKRIEWEHIVPGSLMPIGKHMCWQKEKEIKQCKTKSGKLIKNRNCCDLVSPSGKLMLYDLHNLAPSAGQLNQYRSNDDYGEVPDDSDYEGFGRQCTVRDLNGTTPGKEGLFEPPDCKKGDVARVWFYMRLAHGVNIDKKTDKLFKAWSKADPVSSWERKRHDRIANLQGNINPYVDNIKPKAAGSCGWE